MGDSPLGEFQPQTFEKVGRLLELLEEMGEHPVLRDKLALHGGTAINLFMLDVPRLSVDIDVSYVGAVSRDGMLAERPVVEGAIRDVARGLGYAVSGGGGGHAGRTFVLGYTSPWGRDHVKVDCIYMNRSPVLPLVRRESPLLPGVGVLTFADAELAGGKAKALYDRIKARDLYDVGNISRQLATWTPERQEEAHKVILYYVSLSAAFPLGTRDRIGRFSVLKDEVREQVWPMLRNGTNHPSLEDLLTAGRGFVDSLVKPRDESEIEYLRRLAKGDYRPTLLLGDTDMARAAEKSPEAAWKVLNIKKIAGRRKQADFQEV